jgi:hypothetical protein
MPRDRAALLVAGSAAAEGWDAARFDLPRILPVRPTRTGSLAVAAEGPVGCRPTP